MNLTTIPFIVLVSYLGGEIFKIIVKNKKKESKKDSFFYIWESN